MLVFEVGISNSANRINERVRITNWHWADFHPSYAAEDNQKTTAAEETRSSFICSSCVHIQNKRYPN